MEPLEIANSGERAQMGAGLDPLDETGLRLPSHRASQAWASLGEKVVLAHRTAGNRLDRWIKLGKNLFGESELELWNRHGTLRTLRHSFCEITEVILSF